MRIGHFYTQLGRPSDGAGQAVLSLARAQQSLGHEVRLARWDLDAGRTDISPLPRPVHLRTSFRRQYQRVHEWLQELDILHLHASYYSWKTALVAKSALHSGIPYVYSPHGALTYLRIRRESRKQYLFSRLLGLQTLNNAAWVQAYSPEERGLLDDYGVTSQVLVLPNGVDLESDHQETTNPVVRAIPEVRERGYPIVGFLGRLDIWKKGLDLLLDAFSNIHRNYGVSPYLFIAGPDWYGNSSLLEQRIKELRIESHVLFVGELKQNEVADFLSNLDFLVIPSRYEGFPLVLLEACAARCPVIVSEGSNVAWLVRKHHVGLVSDSNHHFADSIVYLIKNPSELEEMRKNAFTLAGTLSWNEVARCVISHYFDAFSGVK